MYHCADDLLFIFLDSDAFLMLNISFTCLVKSKPVTQEVSRTLIVPPMVSILHLQPFTTLFDLKSANSFRSDERFLFNAFVFVIK